MDTKNVIAAIALSSAVIVLYSLFFIPEKPSINQNLAEKKKIEHEKEKQGHPEHIGENNNNLILEKIQKIEEKLDKILILLTV